MWLALVCSGALAEPKPARVDLEIWMATRAEPGPWGWSDQPQQWFFSAPVDRRRHGPKVDGTVVEDGKVSLSCDLDGSLVWVSLRFVPANYPEHLPEELECPVGGVDVHVRIVPRRPLYREPSELQVDPATGADVRRYARLPREQGSSRTQAFALPTATAWVSQEVAATRGGEPWTDATCTVHPGERPALLVAVTRATADGDGACDLVDADGAAHRIPLHLSSIPPEP